MRELNYVFNNKDLKIPLNLYEAERYEFAVLMHPLVGNLVTYSNRGRYEPQIAKSWSIDKNGSWQFNLHKGIRCENNEEITPYTFKKSIEISVKYLSTSADVPVFSKLIGYQEFIRGNSNSIKGIEASENSLIFRFSEPTRSGVVQILSFAPFGFICSENRNADGSWKNDSQFISSGPYKVIRHDPGSTHILELRENWKNFSPTSPKRVHFYFSLESIKDNTHPTILDSYTLVLNPPRNLKKYNLVPEYINPILLSHSGESGFFASRENRLMLKKAIDIEKAKLPNEIENHYKTDFFYPNQPPQKQNLHLTLAAQFKRPSQPLVIQGKVPQKGDKKYLNWKVLEPALKSLNIEYVFDDSAKTYAEKTHHKYDIRFNGYSIGGGAEAWGLGVIFCSELGPRFPDQSGNVCKAIEAHEKGQISDQQFTEEFNQAVFDDVSVIPVTHYGVLLYLSPEINLEYFSPLISVIRFEQLEMD